MRYSIRFFGTKFSSILRVHSIKHRFASCCAHTSKGFLILSRQSNVSLNPVLYRHIMCCQLILSTKTWFWYGKHIWLNRCLKSEEKTTNYIKIISRVKSRVSFNVFSMHSITHSLSLLSSLSLSLSLSLSSAFQTVF